MATRGLALATGFVGFVIGSAETTGAWQGVEFLKQMVAKAAAMLPSPSAAAAPDATQLAVAASLQTVASSMEKVMRAQKSGRTGAVFLLIGAPVGIGLALYRFGWGKLGWVTPEQLKGRLADVTTSVAKMVAAAKTEICARVTAIEQRLFENTAAVEQVGARVEEVKVDLQKIGDSVDSLEQRFIKVEKNSKRSADGVELLCEFVSTAPMLKIDDDVHAKLRAFGNLSLAQPLQLELKSTASAQPQERVPPLAMGMDSSRPSHSATAPSGFLQSLLSSNSPAKVM
mmetsp:Transcript_63168/g.105068  ORF Transcript_63168/g.105068 Transcript_63168/m.105068 type:complete len:285 (-) Transcript_63168:375-1229(-)|eukprot:CAMPEP_0119311198 /NCGR_PEP_ID=MMETSP1333-20130426/21969_1 /TAXON_ID=418940 /ORGANISM="Scyphosphaera apsteinii, Strain RCC1455" /LENGTH=284 /DNA_ID=CAMNT_0007315525 /DNA_START=17 /DNA_END=871 /DNA_ORIENTATION=-